MTSRSREPDARSAAEELRGQVDDLRWRLQEAEQTLEAIRNGEVDALVVGRSGTEQVFTLRGADHPYRVLVEQMNEAALTLTDNGTIVYSNRRFGELVGAASEGAVGRNLASYVAERQDPSFAELLRRARSDAVTSEFFVTDGAGGEIPTSFSVRAITSTASGGFTVVITDLRHLILGQLARDNLAAIVDSTADAVVAWTLEGCIESWNAAAERLFGYDGPSAIGRPVSTLVRADDLVRIDADLVELLRVSTRAPRRMEIVGVHASGAQLDLDVTISVIRARNGKPLGLSWIARDNSERKRLDRLKDSFVSTVSHELRTPLASVLASIGLLRGGVAGALPEVARSMLDLAERNGRRLHRIVDDLLDMQRLDHEFTELQLEDADLWALADSAAAALAELASAESIGLVVEPSTAPARVRVNTDRVGQIIANLISNAVKFSPRGEVVRLRTTVSDTHVELAVIDRGSGVPNGSRGRIFEKFVQADLPDGPPRTGSGLGLPIALALARRMGGTIEFEPNRGKGSTFTLRLPRLET